MKNLIISGSHPSFSKELARLKKKHVEQYREIYIKLRKMEKRVKSIEKGQAYPGLKKIGELYQLTVGDYRIIFEIQQQSIIHYLLLFEKKSNSTPSRRYKVAKKRKDF